MYSKPKINFPLAGNVTNGHCQDDFVTSESSGGGQLNQSSQPSSLIRRTGAWANQGTSSYYWRGRYRPSEPEHDEAFVEEPGIKVFQSSHEDDEESQDEVHEDEDEEDPLYQLDVLDDTIVEEKEDDDEEDFDDPHKSGCQEKIDEGKRYGTGISDVDNVAERKHNETEINSKISLNSGSDSSNQSLDDVFSSTNSQNSNYSNIVPPPASCLPQPMLRWTSVGSNNKVTSTNSTKTTESDEINGFHPQGLNFAENKIIPATASSHIPSFNASSSSSVPQISMSVSGLTTTSTISLGDNIIPASTSLSPVIINPQVQPHASLSPSLSTPTTLPSNQKNIGGTNSRPSSRPSSRSSSPLAVGLTGNMWAGLPNADAPPVTKASQTGYSQPFVLSTGRGRGGRLNLTLNRINAPRHKFTIRRVNESETQAKRTAAYIDSRNQDLSRQGRTSASPIWLRKFSEPTTGGSPQGTKTAYSTSETGTATETSAGIGSIANSGSGTTHILPDKAKQLEEIEVIPTQGGYRPRSGTWSIANSRRNKIKQEKEEEVQTRQRRKSGDDILNAKEKEKKKEATPGFLDSFRPRSKSDAARGKKPNIISTVKNAVQYSLVPPGGATRGGRRSGDATPVESQTPEDVYHTWHAGSGAKTTIGKVWEIFKYRNESSEDRQRRKSGGKYEKGQLVRRHSMEPERKRNGSGHTYFRGEDPDQATIVFRDCRGLPVTAPFLENVRRSDLEENESQIMVKFFKYHTTYDLIPTSAKLVVFDTKLQVKKAFYALVYNGVRAAPLWDSGRQRFVGMLTITDFIRILQSFYNCPNRKMDELEEHRLELWRTLLHDDVRELISIKPIETLYEAIRSLIHHKIHRLPVIDPDTGSVLYIITHKRILKFLYLYINELPKPSIMLKSLRELNIGTYDNIETARGDTLIIEALNKFVERRISALPIVDDEGRLVDIYAKFDVINLAAEGTYHNLDVTLQQANEYRNEWFEGVLKCTLDETLEMVMERIVRAEVHRLVIVDESNKVIGIISLSDILNELVLKPCHDDPLSLKGRPVSDIVAGIKSSPGNSARSRESLKRDSSSSNKTGSEESVEVTCWGNMSDAKSDERRTSIPETIDGRQYDRPMDRTQHEILPISS